MWSIQKVLGLTLGSETGCQIDVCVQCSLVPSVDHNQFLLYPFQCTVITLPLNAIQLVIVDQELVADILVVMYSDKLGRYCKTMPVRGMWY